MHFLIIGAGYSGFHIAKLARQSGTVCGTRRDASSLGELQRLGVDTLVLSGLTSEMAVDFSSKLPDDLLDQLSRVTHLVSCAGPASQPPLDDPVLRLLQHRSAHMPLLEWLGYLSTIGVYGDHGGNWVDETTPCTSTQSRSIMRREAELGWLALADQKQVPLSTLRLSGIYGPGRNAVEDAIAGRARVLTKPSQVFNRIHVEDLATATVKAATLHHHGVVNITDDLPAAPEEVVFYAHQLAGRPNPPLVDVDSVQISEMARSFYCESKRVSNALSKQVLGMQYRYPSYREGLDALWDSIKPDHS